MAMAGISILLPSATMTSPIFLSLNKLKTEFVQQVASGDTCGSVLSSSGTRERWGRERQQGEQPEQKAEEAAPAQGPVCPSCTLCPWGARPRRVPPELPTLSCVPSGPPPEGLVSMLSLHTTTHAQPHPGGLWPVLQHPLLHIPGWASSHQPCVW